MILSLLTTLVVSAFSTNASAEAIYYPPSNTTNHDFSSILNGSGRPGIYNSSRSQNYGEYNWCNMPHVRKSEYKQPDPAFILQYIEVIHRHHKRTPYASNTFSKEDVTWDCTGEGPVHYGRSSSGHGSHPSVIQWQNNHDAQNPFMGLFSPGFVNSNCFFPQITAEALDDSYVHGVDLRRVYAPLLHLGAHPNSKEFRIRVTTNVITSQVSGALLSGLFPGTRSQPWPAYVQSDKYDSLEPSYSCPKANSIRSTYTSGNDGETWKSHLTEAGGLYSKLDSVSGISNPDNGGWHNSFDHYYDNMSAKQCHGKSLPCNLDDPSSCISQEEADTVYRIGNWEYYYLWRGAPSSAHYSALHYGAWFLELKARLQSKINGSSHLKYVHNVAHDGSISSVLSFLQIDQMVWPGMGSEVVFELYKNRSSKWFIRILWSGQPMKTSTPLGVVDMLPIEDFLACTLNSSIFGHA